MKSRRETLTLHGGERRGCGNITPEVEAAVERSGVHEGPGPDAHHKRRIMGREVVAVTAGRLDFGPWEEIFCGEFDGRRDKRVLIKIIGE